MKQILAAGLFIVALATAPAYAAPIVFFANLSGPAEEPPNASPGTGVTLVTIDPTAHTMDIDVSFSGLVGTTTVSHIHVINGPGDANTADTNGPVATTTPTFPGFPAGVTSGTYLPSPFDTLAAGTYNPVFVTAAGSIAMAELALFQAIIDGRAYLNIHTNVFPGGEIRGFLQPVPEPTSLLLFGTGIAVIARHTKRMRRR